MDEGTAEAEEGIQVANAGLVLLAPFLPRLFSILELVEHSSFNDLSAAGRGVQLLQWLVDEPTADPEVELVLNKLLCGLEPDFQVTRSVEPGEAEMTEVEALLTAAIEHWGALGNHDVLLDQIPWRFGVIALPWMEGIIRVDWR